jgi:hypothetical protein
MRSSLAALRAAIALAAVVAPASGEDCSGSLLAKPGVTVPAKIETKLRSVAARYCAAQKEAGRSPTSILVVSGVRSTAEEATELKRRLDAGDDLSIYENQEAVVEIKRTYSQGGSLKALLDSQVRRGCYISKHLFDQAVDIRNTDMDRLSKAAFRAAATQEGARIVEREGSKVPDHFHLNFPPYPGDPQKCPK